MLSLVIESASANDSLDLGALLDGNEGVQAIAGLTGAGLPPVSVQWSEGAGDGATYRGKRVLPRDMDIPLFVSSPTRAGLRSVVKRLSRILADEATLTLTDSVSGEWTLKVVRVGGGDFIYGPDTDGEHDLAFAVTLRAGQPFWTSTTATSVQKLGATQLSTPSVALYNNGSHDCPVLWEIRGPGKNLEIAAPGGVGLKWNGTLANGETIFIDTEKGTVVDGLGANRYAELAQSPRFAYVKSQDTTTWNISWPNADAGVARTNLVINPNAVNNTTGYANEFNVNSFTANANGSGITVNYSTTQDTRAFRYGDIAVTPGLSYTAAYALGGVTSQVQTVGIYIRWMNGATVLSTSGASSNYLSDPNWADRPHVTATAPIGATHAQMIVQVRFTSASISSFKFRQFQFEQRSTLNGYFDGNTADTATIIYAWTGTANASTSTLSLVPDRTTAMVKATFNERDWMVI